MRSMHNPAPKSSKRSDVIRVAAHGELQALSKRQTRVARVIEYVQRNLDAPLSVERLGRVAHVSKHHLHRQLSSAVGIGAIKMVQLLRLKRASFRLLFEQRPSITNIAMDNGFANSESFSRAFRNAFGQSPREFRKAPAWRAWRAQLVFLQRIGVRMAQVEIVNFKAVKVAALEHKGPAEDVYNTSRRFIEWRRANGVSPALSHTYGIHYTEQNKAPPQDYRVDICASVDKDVEPNPMGVVTKQIPNLRCARIRHVGSRENISSVHYLYAEWLPASGETAGDFPVFFHYVNVGPNVQEHEMITDIYLPLK